MFALIIGVCNGDIKNSSNKLRRGVAIGTEFWALSPILSFFIQDNEMSKELKLEKGRLNTSIQKYELFGVTFSFYRLKFILSTYKEIITA